MRPVFMISGGITKFAKAHPDKDFRLMVKQAFDYALNDLGGKLTLDHIDGSVISYFSDHFTRQLKAGAMVRAAALADRVFVKEPPTGVGFARIEDFRRKSGDGVNVGT